jgi:hypothetical protein
MALNNLATDCQAHACALIHTMMVQALKNGEDAVEIFGVKADAIVGYGNLTACRGCCGCTLG